MEDKGITESFSIDKKWIEIRGDKMIQKGL